MQVIIMCTSDIYRYLPDNSKLLSILMFIYCSIMHMYTCIRVYIPEKNYWLYQNLSLNKLAWTWDSIFIYGIPWVAPTEISIVYVYTNMLANGIFATTPCNRNERAPSILNMQLINATLPFLLSLLKNQRNLYLVIFIWII